MEWILVVYLVIVLALLFGLVFGLSRTFVLKKRIGCPAKRQDFDVSFVCKGSYRFPVLLRVKSCSAFDRPRRIRCDRACLKETVSAVSRSRRDLRRSPQLSAHEAS